MPGRVIDLSACRFAFFRNVGPYGPPLQAVWQKLGQWRKDHGRIGSDDEMLGISHDNPMTTPPDQCRYDAGLVVESTFQPAADIGVIDRPAMRVFAVPFEGTSMTIGPAIGAAFDELFAAGHQPAAEPIFERYRGNPMVESKPGVFRCDLCLPIKP